MGLVKRILKVFKSPEILCVEQLWEMGPAATLPLLGTFPRAVPGQQLLLLRGSQPSLTHKQIPQEEMLYSYKDLGKKPWAGEDGRVHPAPEELWGSRGSLASNRGERKGRNGYSHNQVRCRCHAKQGIMA